jgi:hypothetical protein
MGNELGMDWDSGTTGNGRPVCQNLYQNATRHESL